MPVMHAEGGTYPVLWYEPSVILNFWYVVMGGVAITWLQCIPYQLNEGWARKQIGQDDVM